MAEPTLFTPASLEASQRKPRFAKVGRLFILISAPLVTLLGFAYIYVFDPNSQGRFFVPCFFRATTGLYCPGCGNTRALHALLHLDILESLHNNLIFPFLAFLLMWLLVGEYVRLLVGRRVLWLPTRVHPAIIVIACVIVVAFSVLRNVPFYPFTLLAPL